MCVCVCVCVCSFLNVVILCVFTLGTRLSISKFCVDLCKKKSDRTRCLAASILEFNINWNSKSAERAKAFWFSEGRTKKCSDSTVVRDE